MKWDSFENIIKICLCGSFYGMPGKAFYTKTFHGHRSVIIRKSLIWSYLFIFECSTYDFKNVCIWETNSLLMNILKTYPSKSLTKNLWLRKCSTKHWRKEVPEFNRRNNNNKKSNWKELYQMESLSPEWGWLGCIPLDTVLKVFTQLYNPYITETWIK